MSNSAVQAGDRGRPAGPTGLRRSGSPRRVLVTLELVTGVTGLAGGVMLAAVPDGSLLRADPAVLAGSPFNDWRIPGVLLAGLVGGGFLLAGWWQWRGYRHARELSMAAGAGLVCSEPGRRAGLARVPALGGGVRSRGRSHRRPRLAHAMNKAATAAGRRFPI